MNASPALEVNGALLKFRVVFTSASDHGHGGGERSVVLETFDVAEAIERAKKPAQWGDLSIELEGWR